MFRKISPIVASLFLVLPVLAAAETHEAAPSPHAGHAMPSGEGHSGQAGTWKGEQGPSSQAYSEANARMHEGMDIEFTGDADIDFVRGMIAHHEGAIDMARIVIEHGADPEIRALAEAVIATQSEEVDFMRDWLARNGAPAE